MAKGIKPTLTVLLLFCGVLAGADRETTNFKSYVDLDICSHLFLGPVTQTRLQCSKDTNKQGSNAVLVRLTDNWVFQVNKEKMLNKLIGKTANASGEVNYGDSTMKLQSIEPLGDASTAAGKDRAVPAMDTWAQRVRHFLNTAHELSPADAEKADKSYRPYGN